MGYAPPVRVNMAINAKDHPELDDSEFVTDAVRKKYWSLMEISQWAVTIRRIGIHVVGEDLGCNQG